MEHLKKILNLILVKNEFESSLDKLKKGNKSSTPKESIYMAIKTGIEGKNKDYSVHQCTKLLFQAFYQTEHWSSGLKFCSIFHRLLQTFKHSFASDFAYCHKENLLPILKKRLNDNL
jgi:hypothetical protein